MSTRLDQPLAEAAASAGAANLGTFGCPCGACVAERIDLVRSGADVVLDELRAVPATWTVVKALEYLTFDHAPIEGVPE